MACKMIRQMLTVARNASKSSYLILKNVKSARGLSTWNRVKMRSPSISFSQIRCLGDDARKCWNCHFSHNSGLFCSKCKSLQELPDNATYFDVIGVKQEYDIPLAQLQHKYKQLQSLLHPDKLNNKSEKEKQLSESLSSFVNKAYNTLLHPLSRGLYILKINNVSIAESTMNLNKDFLLEIMERNEEIEGASQDRDKIMILADENKQILDDLAREVGAAFQSSDLERAKQLLIKMKYYTTIGNTLKKIKQDLVILE